jgi:hypothetical protein
MHILGYGFDESSPSLLQKLAYVQQARRDRNPKIVENLNRLGLAVTMEEVSAEAGGEVVGRPHFAAVLLRKGIVQSIQEAFDRFLAKGQPAYMDKVRLSPEDSIAAIRAAGGVAVLAHPLQLKTASDEALEALLAHLAHLGLRGMECYYRNHTGEDTARFLGLARRHDLVPTGGSDFHGSNRPRIRLGTGERNLCVPRECWDNLVSRRVGK